jgi:NADH-quinone oxidoreductase subunit L
VLDALALIPILPLAGFAVLALAGPRLSARAVAWLGVGSVALSLVAAVAVIVSAAVAVGPGGRVVQPLWTWMRVGEFAPAVAFSLDGLSAVMVLVVTSVGTLIHIYAASYMAGDPGYRRFFAYMNFFVGMMLILVLADNLLLLYLGWEGVGLASYLLIGFWYGDRKNGRAAQKAFIVTRIGDTALAIGLFLLFWELGTLDLATAVERAQLAWSEGDARVTLAAALILAGAAGKSAQIPLHVWLPDAMAGPTPVSALIHAATMVTAGVYLIARLYPIFELAPAVLLAVAIVGTLTLLLGALSALVQRDLKRVLAYSTMSQLGYMVLALGVGAYAAAIFHLITHAFFKALLFLAAGQVIAALRGEHDLARMGGLRHALPVPFWTFLIGAASLAALPIVTAGFYSKELILWAVWTAEPAGALFAIFALLGTLLTALYAFRVVFLAFFGEARTEPEPPRRDRRITVPLVILAALAVVAGALETPGFLGGAHALSGVLEGALPAAAHGTGASAIALALVAGMLAVAGIALAYLAYGRRPVRREAIPGVPARAARAAAAGFGFDALYHWTLVRPLGAAAHALRGEPVDRFYEAIARVARALHHLLAWTQRGRVRLYLGVLVVGVILLVAYAVLA